MNETFCEWEKNADDDIVFYCSNCMMPNDLLPAKCPSCNAIMENGEDD